MASSEDAKKNVRLSRLQTNVVKLLDCPVCFERITPPVTVCHNGHAVCNDCRTKLLTCPTCKSDFSTNRNTILDQIIEENIFGCKYTQKGCTREMKLREIEEHEEKECIYRTTVCIIINAKKEACNCEVSICEYQAHVNACHRSDFVTIEFSAENKRTIDIGSCSRSIRVLRDMKTSKFVLEVVKHDRILKKFYITYVYIGTGEEANKHGYELRILNAAEKYRELRYKTLCVPVGMTEAEMEDSERCLVLSTSIFPNFTTNELLTYVVKFESLAKKWYKKVGRRWTYGFADEENALSEESDVNVMISLAYGCDPEMSAILSQRLLSKVTFVNTATWLF